MARSREDARQPTDPAAAPLDSRARIPALDGLRGLAILLVLVGHFATGGTDTVAGGLDRWIVKLTGGGWSGVDLFFVLSGFLITGILYDTRRSPTYLRDFYARRALRIFPLYYGVLLFLFVLLPRLSPAAVPGLQDVSAHQAWLWTYCTNFGIILKGAGHFNNGSILTYHFWSLAAEEQFYLVWPMAVLWLRRETLMRLCAVCIGLCLISRFGLAASGYAGVYTCMPCRLDGLMSGAFVALAARSSRGLWALVPAARRIGLLCGIALAAIVATIGMDPFHWITKTVGYTLLAGFFGSALILVLAAPAAAPWARVFSGRTLRFFGKYSYGLYVWHYLLKTTFNRYFSVDILADHGVGRLWAARVAYVLLSIIASVAVAWLSWHLYERHFLQLKRFFEYRPAPRPGADGPKQHRAIPATLAPVAGGASHP